MFSPKDMFNSSVWLSNTLALTHAMCIKYRQYHVLVLECQHIPYFKSFIHSYENRNDKSSTVFAQRGLKIKELA